MAKFDADTLSALREAKEVAIRTEKHPERAVTIWVAVADDEVFVRSVNGARGRWYRDLSAGGRATLEVAGYPVAVEAFAAREADAVDRASRALLAKYQSSPWAPAMVKPEVLPTTLRLEPR